MKPKLIKEIITNLPMFLIKISSIPTNPVILALKIWKIYKIIYYFLNTTFNTTYFIFWEHSCWHSKGFYAFLPPILLISLWAFLFRSQVFWVSAAIGLLLSKFFAHGRRKCSERKCFHWSRYWLASLRCGELFHLARW